MYHSKRESFLSVNCLYSINNYRNYSRQSLCQLLVLIFSFDCRKNLEKTCFWTPLAKIMACCLPASSHYVNQCWLHINMNLINSKTHFTPKEFEKDLIYISRVYLRQYLGVKIIVKSNAYTLSFAGFNKYTYTMINSLKLGDILSTIYPKWFSLCNWIQIAQCRIPNKLTLILVMAWCHTF